MHVIRYLDWGIQCAPGQQKQGQRRAKVKSGRERGLHVRAGTVASLQWDSHAQRRHSVAGRCSVGRADRLVQCCLLCLRELILLLITYFINSNIRKRGLVQNASSPGSGGPST